MDETTLRKLVESEFARALNSVPTDRIARAFISRGMVTDGEAMVQAIMQESLRASSNAVANILLKLNQEK